jgi:hypothetical protein
MQDVKPGQTWERRSIPGAPCARFGSKMCCGTMSSFVIWTCRAHQTSNKCSRDHGHGWSPRRSPNIVPRAIDSSPNRYWTYLAVDRMSPPRSIALSETPR